MGYLELVAYAKWAESREAYGYAAETWGHAAEAAPSETEREFCLGRKDAALDMQKTQFPA